MTTYQIASPSDLGKFPDQIDEGTRLYLQERLRQRFYEIIVKEYIARRKADPSFTQAELAKIIKRNPAQITRWLSAPSNLTVDTISDLLLGISGADLEIHTSYFNEQSSRNQRSPSWLNSTSVNLNDTPIKMSGSASIIVGTTQFVSVPGPDTKTLPINSHSGV